MEPATWRVRVTSRDYSGDLVKAVHSVLLELVRLLGEYRMTWFKKDVLEPKVRAAVMRDAFEKMDYVLRF